MKPVKKDYANRSWIVPSTPLAVDIYFLLVTIFFVGYFAVSILTGEE